MYQEQPRFTGREKAREILTAKVNSKPPLFSTYPHSMIVEHAAWCLRWIDCAPEGANHLIAPLQDKRGVPCGGQNSENIGPNQALREARAARGRNPFGG